MLLMNQLKPYSHFVHSSQTTPDWVNQVQISLNPHGFFVEFLTSINCDHSLLLDFLISNETNFLPYFHMYLRHLANDWCGFISVVKQGEDQQLSKTVKPLSHDCDDVCDVRINGGKVDSLGNSGGVVGDYDDCDDKLANNGGSDGEDSNMRDVNGGDGDMEDACSVGGDNIGIDDGDASGINDHGNGNVSGVGGTGGNSVGDDDVDDNDMGDVGNKGGVNTGVNHADGGDNVGDDSDSGSSDGNSNMRVDVGTDGDGGNSIGVDDSDDGHMGDNGVDSDGGVTDGNCSDGGVTDGNSSDGGSFNHVGHGGDDDDSDVNGSNNSNSDIVGGSSDDDVVMCNISNLQKTLTCLIRLRYAIERMSSKGLFPYPVTPLVKLMEYIETLYEGQQ